MFSVTTLFLSKVALAFGFDKLWQGSLCLLWVLTGQLYEHHLWWITYTCVCIYIHMCISSFVGSYFLTPDLLGGDCWHTVWTLGFALSFLGFLLGWSANQDLFSSNPIHCLKRNFPAPWPFLVCCTTGQETTLSMLWVGVWSYWGAGSKMWERLYRKSVQESILLWFY